MIREASAPFPAAPEGKGGWPWDAPAIDSTVMVHHSLPRISIITPSFNQGHSIEKTIRSVLLQNYPHIEYIIMDGGSNDNTLDVLRKYQRYFAFWVSKKDGGHYAAVREGFSRASGDIVAWINSDDGYMPGVFSLVANTLSRSPQLLMLYGNSLRIREEDDQVINVYRPKSRWPKQYLLYTKWYIPQESVFWTKTALSRVGQIDPRWAYAADYDLITRTVIHGKTKHIDKALSYASVSSREQVKRHSHIIEGRSVYDLERWQIASLLARGMLTPDLQFKVRHLFWSLVKRIDERWLFLPTLQGSRDLLKATVRWHWP